MVDITQFNKRIDLIVARVEDNLEKAVRKAALAIDQTVVLSTPVDTGRARSNWLVNIDTPSRGQIDPYSPGQGLGTGEGANARAALEQGKEAISRFRLGNKIYLSNNLPYIQKLNDGFSAQAPAGFVEKAVQSGRIVIRRAKLLGKTNDN
jgi:hypothetical protein